MVAAYGTNNNPDVDDLATPVRIPAEYLVLLTPQGDRPGLLTTPEEYNELISSFHAVYLKWPL